MDKKELFKKIGSLQQLVYARPIAYREGRSEWMNAVEVKCGNLAFHSQLDKCLDLSDLSYKGLNLSFLSKPGLIGRNPFDTAGAEAQRSIMCGFFFTCGLESICSPHVLDGKEYPMHGRMRTTPAEHVSTDVIEGEDGIKVVITGEMREAELFGENMVLRRKIESTLGDDSIVITDEVENQSYRKEPLMLMYHCNMGYPFLDDGSELVLPSEKVRGREEFSEKHLDKWNVMEAPVDNAEEYVYIHELAADSNGNTGCLFINRKYDVALLIEFNKNQLPYFNQWKSLASGDYVMGLEPANAMAYNRAYHKENGLLRYLEPFEKSTYSLKFTVIEGKEKIEEKKAQLESLM